MIDQIKNLVYDQNAIDIFSVIKEKVGSNSYSNVSLAWVADAYIQSSNKLKIAFETNVFTQVPYSKQKIVQDTMQSIVSVTQTILALAYPNPQVANPYMRNQPQWTTWQNQVVQGTNHYTTLANSVIQLQNVVDDCRIDERLLGFQNYQEHLENLSQLIQSYDETLSQTQTINEFFEKTSNQSAQIAESVLKSDEQIKLITNLVKEGEEGNIEANNALEEIEKNRLNVKNLNQEVENSKVQIVAFHNNIEAYKKQIDDSTQNLDQYMETAKVDYFTSIDTMLKRSDTIVLHNEEYQKIINNLLKGANAGRLNQTFDDKAIQIEKYQYMWLVGLVLSTVALVVLVSVVINQMGEKAAPLLFIARMTLAIPFIFLDAFFILQYNKRQSLIDEYRFKSSIALSLWSFDELLRENKTDDVSKDFIISSIQKIYQSPFQVDDDFNKQQKELLGSFMKSAGAKVDKVTDGLLDKVMK